MLNPLKPGDVHMVISHTWRSLKVYRKTPEGAIELFRSDALTEGVGDPGDVGRQDLPNSDTPFGRYKFSGEIIETQSSEGWATRAAYGPWFLGLLDEEGQERRVGRAGIGMHGGRQGDYAPEPSERRLLYPTHGCIRVYDDILTHQIVPLVRDTLHAGRAAYVTVGP